MMSIRLSKSIPRSRATRVLDNLGVAKAATIQGQQIHCEFPKPQTDEDTTNRGRRRIIHVKRSPTASSPEPFVVSLHSLNLSVVVITNGVTTHKPGCGEHS